MSITLSSPKLIAFIAGCLFPLAFAPFNLFPIGFLAPLALYLSWELAPPRQAWLCGYLFGLSSFGIGVSWIYISIHEMGNVPIWLSGIITGLFIAFLALFPALQGYLTARFFWGNTPSHIAFTFPALWVIIEILRGWIFTGFPWMDLGYSQINTPLSGFAPILGILGVSFVSAVTAGLLLIIWRAQGLTRIIWLVALALIWGGGEALKYIEWTIPYNKPLRVSVLQVAIPQKVRWLPNERLNNVYRYLELMQNNWGAQLIILPENALTFFYHDVIEFLTALTKEAQAHNAALLIGLPVMDEKALYAGDNSIYYNAVIGLPGYYFYFKRHLVPFTEFLPLKQFFSPIIKNLQIPMSNFSHGPDQQKPIKLAGHQLGISICYEAAFAREINTALPDAELLINVSNDGWFGYSLAPHQNLQIVQMRALETGRWLVRSTNTGISAVINHKGKIIADTPLFQDAVLTTDVQPMIGVTPYINTGDLPIWAIIILGLAAGHTVNSYRQKL